MGCSNTRTINDDYLLGPPTIKLNLSKPNSTPSLENANEIISSIIKLRNRFLAIYHRLIYKSGAYVFVNPTIKHCTKCTFYKVSSEFKGNFQEANFIFIEDPPYLRLGDNKFSADSKNVLFNLFDFIIEIRSYKALIKQLDKDTPELFYLIHENPNNISQENIKNINMGIDLLKKINNFRNDILQHYKNEIYTFITRTDDYCKSIDIVGKIAYEKKETDILKIGMLYKETETYQDEIKLGKTINLLFNSEEEAYKRIKSIMDKDTTDGDAMLSSRSYSSFNNDDHNDINFI